MLVHNELHNRNHHQSQCHLPHDILPIESQVQESSSYFFWCFERWCNWRSLLPFYAIARHTTQPLSMWYAMTVWNAYISVWIQVTTLCQTSLQTCTKSPVDLDVVGGLNPHMMSTAASNGLLLISNCPRIWCVLFQDLTWHDRWSEKPIQICCIQNQKIVFKCLHGHWLPLGTSPLTARSHAWSGLLPSWIFWTRCLKCPGLSKCLTRIENWSLCS